MKTIKYIVLFLISNFAFGNRIDALKTSADVEKFPISIHPDFVKYPEERLQIKSTIEIAQNLPCDGIFKEWKIKNWEKVDINNDGLTDLIFFASQGNRYEQYIIMDKSNNIYELIPLEKNTRSYCGLAKPIIVEGKNQLKLYYHTDKRVIDTLTYKFENFIELNQKKSNPYEIEDFTFETKTSEGVYAQKIFKLQIDRKGKVLFSPKFQTLCNDGNSLDLSKQFIEFTELFSYIRIKDLDNFYHSSKTDQITIKVIIKFKNGSVKEIEDYGMEGTFGLKAVYTKLIKLMRDNQWLD